MSTHLIRKSPRVSTNQITEISARGVTRALEARKTSAKTQLSSEEIQQLSGGYTPNPLGGSPVIPKFPFPLDPCWFGICPDPRIIDVSIYENDVLLTQVNR